MEAHDWESQGRAGVAAQATEAKAAKDRSRTAAYPALAQVILVSDDEKLEALARRSHSLLKSLHDVPS